MEVLNNVAEVDDGSAILCTVGRGIQLQAGDHIMQGLQYREMPFYLIMVDT